MQPENDDVSVTDPQIGFLPGRGVSRDVRRPFATISSNSPEGLYILPFYLVILIHAFKAARRELAAPRPRGIMRTLIVSVSALCLLLWTASAQSPRTVWDGVFTKDQAEIGHGIFGDECAGCHGDNLETGGDSGPALAGDGFKDEWNNKSLADLFDLLSTRMPQSSPGSLKKAEYAALLAYILSENDFPAGAKAL